MHSPSSRPVALVTGASRGIGKAIAAGFAEAGAKVMLTSRKQADLDAAAAEIAPQGRQGDVAAFAAHVGRPADAVACVDATIERFRGKGVGTATIALLRAECHRRGIRPVAGCWYYNHTSKRTLERAGMYSPTRLLRIDY